MARVYPILIVHLLILVGFFSTTHAIVFTPDGAIDEIEKRLVEVRINQDTKKAKVIVTDTISASRDFFWIHPFQKNAQSFALSMDGKPVSLKILASDEAKNFLFDQAVKHQDTRFFRLAVPPFETLGIAQITAEKSVEIQLEYLVDITSVQSFWQTEIFFDDRVVYDHLSVWISVQSATKNQHFFTTLPKGDEAHQERHLNALAAIWEKNNASISGNAKFFWSYEPNPALFYHYPPFTYWAHFHTPVPKKTPQLVHFFVDGSGSMRGRLWEKLEEILITFFQLFPAEIKISFTIIGSDPIIFDVENPFFLIDEETKKDLLNWIQNQDPSGKINLEVEKLWDPLQHTEEEAIIFISDDNTPPHIPGNMPIIFISFGDNPQKSEATVFSRNGWYQKVFGDIAFVDDLAAIKNKWQNWKKIITSDVITKKTGEQDLLSRKFFPSNTEESAIFIGRNEETLPGIYGKETNFIPRLWAERRVAQIFREKNFSTEIYTALIAIARSFGVESVSINGEIQVPELEKKITTVPPKHDEIFSLEKNFHLGSVHKKTKFWGPYPLFLVAENTWEGYDFPQKNDKNPDLLIKIAPFSEAQKDLFFRFPEWLSQGFGVSKRVNFCTPHRCILIAPGERKNPVASDRAFFHGFNNNHWYSNAVKKLVLSDVMTADEKGDLRLPDLVTRGQFALMLARQKTQNQIPLYEGEKIFSDLDVSSPYHDAVYFWQRKGVLQGYGDGFFRPKKPLSRAEAVKIMLAAENFSPKAHEEKSTFSDVSDWAIPWVNEGAKRGTLTGYLDGSFRPHQTLNRAEAAVILTR